MSWVDALGALPSWILIIHVVNTIVWCLATVAHWRLSWSGSTYEGITPLYWRKLWLFVAVAVLFVGTSGVLVAARLAADP